MASPSSTKISPGKLTHASSSPGAITCTSTSCGWPARRNVKDFVHFNFFQKLRLVLRAFGGAVEVVPSQVDADGRRGFNRRRAEPGCTGGGRWHHCQNGENQ